ncbi:hypothetical protein PtB15_5B105 [Puccinia triticina]|nr:hypothetical protein PtB15_5B105 [Puccinia triticina]
MMPTPVPPSPSELAIPKSRSIEQLKNTSSTTTETITSSERRDSNLMKQKNNPQGSAPHPLLNKSLALLLSGFRYSLFILLLSILLSRMITEHWLWGYNGKWAKLSYYFPGPQESFTIERLALHDGVKDPSKPILLSINGNVYNVNSNPGMYGPGGSYHHFAGRDASRAFVTGCFKTGLTFDLRGLDQRQQKSLDYWTNFFENSPKYFKVGNLILPDLEQSNTPIPKDCDPKTEGGAI